MKILGINDQHNASACLLDDGVVVAALQEERLTRIKNHFCFPQRSIKWVLESTGVRAEELDVVAIASEHITRAFTGADLVESYAKRNSLGSRALRVARKTPAMRIAKSRRRAARLQATEEVGLPLDRVEFVEHHTAHAAAAYHGGPWKEGKTLVITADGEGDGLAASIRVGEDGRLSAPLVEIASSESLGLIWAAITAFSGMVPYEHEYKLMGLAPYAPDSGATRSYEQFKRTLALDDANPLAWRRAKDMPCADRSYDFFRERLEMHRFDWIAAGLQRFTEEFLADWVRQAIRVAGIDRIALGGGVFMNVKANKAIYNLPEVDELFVFPSCGDETNCFGAAYHVEALAPRRNEGQPQIPGIGPVYWGPEIDDRDVEALLLELDRDGYRAQRYDDIEAMTADLLANGEVVARAKGRLEFGARALGNRSILADPTSPDVVRHINEMIKSRDFWMPFAPALLEEYSDDYVVNPRGMPAPYMIMSFDTTDRVGDLAASIHPYDQTARPQVVSAEQNPDFHRLIQTFGEKTGRHAVLNTSFNLHGYPIVNSAEDAANVLRRSGLQYLAVGNYLIRKPGA